MSRKRPPTLPLAPKSERVVLRVAMALAFEQLSWSDQGDLKSRARELLVHLKQSR